MNNIRIDWIDLTKGIAIFLMVCGHTSIPLSISNWIWSFHMPLFFLRNTLFSPRLFASLHGQKRFYKESYLMQQNIPTLTCL